MLSTLLTDVRFGLRRLRTRPGFTAAAVLTLALGIGANVAIFSVIRGVLLSPLPYARGEDIVRVNQHTAKSSARVGFSPIEVAAYREQNASFDAIAEYHNMYFILL